MKILIKYHLGICQNGMKKLDYVFEIIIRNSEDLILSQIVESM